MAKQEQIDALADGEPGVGIVKDKKLDALADAFTEARDEKAALATKMTEIEGKIIERMQTVKILVYKYADREVKIRAGKAHIKVKTVKVGNEPE